MALLSRTAAGSVDAQAAARAARPSGRTLYVPADAALRLDCDLDAPIVRKMRGDVFRPEHAAQTDDVAQTHQWAQKQPHSAWSNEVELRPFTETWTI